MDRELLLMSTLEVENIAHYSKLIDCQRRSGGFCMRFFVIAVKWMLMKLEMFSEQYLLSIATAQRFLFYLKYVRSLIEVVNERG